MAFVVVLEPGPTVELPLPSVTLDPAGACWSPLGEPIVSPAPGGFVTDVDGVDEVAGLGDWTVVPAPPTLGDVASTPAGGRWVPGVAAEPVPPNVGDVGPTPAAGC